MNEEVERRKRQDMVRAEIFTWVVLVLVAGAPLIEALITGRFP